MHTKPSQRRTSNLVVIAVLTVIAAVLPGLGLSAAAAPAQAAAAAPAPGAISLHVQAARSVGSGAGLVHKGDAVSSYKWIINRDDTGDPGTESQPLLDKCLPARAPGGSTDPDYADTCPWPSTRSTSGWAPIVAQGDQSDLSDATSLPDLPGGKYLISVTADDFKIGGQHFTVDGGSSKVVVDLDPTPLPLSTIRIDVFNDSAPVDGTFEVDAESGLSGFTAHLTDVFGDVSTDYYGNPLCTTYQHKNANGTGPMLFDANNHPIISSTSTGRCVSDRGGHIVIPNMGPNRLAATVSPPATQTSQWAQTTTLEGGHDHDIWSQEGATGFDTELVKGGEPVASVQFGFVKTRAMSVPRTNPPTGEIKGVAVAGLPYIGGQNGQTVPETGFAGANVDGPIKSPWVALSDLGAGDAAVYVGRGAADGSFDIKNVPDGSYQLTLWDDDQDYILWSFNVEVSDGGVSDVGNKMLVGWFSHLHGHVFVDSNENGKRDPGEQGVAQFPLTVRERDNSLMDQYTNSSSTDSSGAYDIRETYPLGKWLVLEAFNTRYRTTGITYQGENETKATTRLGGLVDLDFLPVIGLGGSVDWGVQPYAGAANGGIAGTVSYDTTRNELDPADAASEGYQPGIPHVKVHLYAPVACSATTDADKANECRQGHEIVPLQVPDTSPGAAADAMVKNPDPDRGAMVKGPELSESYTSEEWAAPRGCTARDYQGNPLTDQNALPEPGETADRLCVESPMQGIALGPSDKTPGNASQTVNGNYAFATTDVEQFPPTDPRNTSGLDQYAALPAGQTEDLVPGDYIVAVDIPKNPVGGGDMYKATSEEDVNVFDGDSYLPQENLGSITPAVAGDVPPGAGNDPTPPSQPPSQQAGIISPCAGALHTVRVTDQPFLDGGGSPFEGQDRPSCASKLVTVRSGQTTAPNFNLFTDVPIPTHFWGLTINDLGLTLDKRSVQYGEALGLPHVPMGLYDWAGRLLDTTHTDFNGFYEALEPSTDTFNCPVPAGPCPNMYRFTGNDPGSPDHPNADYNARYRTISTNFQGWPGLYTVTDTAPTQVATTALTPGSTAVNQTQCDLGDSWPQLLAVDRPYVRQNTAGDNRAVSITGRGFGATAGVLKVGATTVVPTSWSDGQIKFTVPATVPQGPQPIGITRSGAGGLKSVNTLTLQVLAAASTANSATNPRLAEVGPGKPYATVQAALEAARPTATVKYWMVVVWPGKATALEPHGEYNENLIVHHRVHIQGVGPGGFRADGTFVPGSIIDGSGFNPDNVQGQAWLQRIGSLTYSGNPQVPDAAVVTVLDDPTNTNAPASYPVTVDGLQITGGSQTDYPTNVNEVTGGFTTPYGANGALVTQGGGIYVHSNVQGMQVTDNVIVGNGGSYGGGVRVGTPYRTDNRNTGFTLARNQVRDNGGTNLAGGIGIFAGSTGYSVADNAICGNFSAEYGGAVTAFGYQSNAAGANGGTISGNRIWFNSSYDEGGAVMVAGELPALPTSLSEGTGAVTIDKNVISENLANDDGGGLRLLQVSGSHVSKATPGTVTITNNTVTENISTHEGGGIALDDAAFTDIVDNTIAKNLTTASAVTSDGLPAPAGLSTAQNSDLLQARLKNTTLFPGSQTLAATTFSKPTLLDDVFNDNRAGSFSGGWITGIGGTLPDGTANDTNTWDMGLADGSGTLSPVSSVIQSTQGTDGGTSTTVSDTPGFKDPSTVSVDVLASRTYPAFRQSLIIGELLPPTLASDYHLTGGTAVAYGKGAASTTVSRGTGTAAWSYTVSASPKDIDNDSRPAAGTTRRYDAGSDQVVP